MDALTKEEASARSTGIPFGSYLARVKNYIRTPIIREYLERLWLDSEEWRQACDVVYELWLDDMTIQAHIARGGRGPVEYDERYWRPFFLAQWTSSEAYARLDTVAAIEAIYIGDFLDESSEEGLTRTRAYGAFREPKKSSR